MIPLPFDFACGNQQSIETCVLSVTRGPQLINALPAAKRAIWRDRWQCGSAPAPLGSDSVNWWLPKEWHSDTPVVTCHVGTFYCVAVESSFWCMLAIEVQVRPLEEHRKSLPLLSMFNQQNKNSERTPGDCSLKGRQPLHIKGMHFLLF